jgi:hypothetical protein
MLVNTTDYHIQAFLEQARPAVVSNEGTHDEDSSDGMSNSSVLNIEAYLCHRLQTYHLLRLLLGLHRHHHLHCDHLL